MMGSVQSTSCAAAQSGHLNRIASEVLASERNEWHCNRFVHDEGYKHLSGMSVKLVNPGKGYMPETKKAEFDILCVSGLRNCTAAVVKIPTSNGSIHSLFHPAPSNSRYIEKNKDFSDLLTSDSYNFGYHNFSTVNRTLLANKGKQEVVVIHPHHIDQLYTKRSDDYASFTDLKPFSVTAPDKVSPSTMPTVFDVFFDTKTEEAMAVQKSGNTKFLGKIFHHN